MLPVPVKNGSRCPELSIWWWAELNPRRAFEGRQKAGSSDFFAPADLRADRKVISPKR
jgi:hypothetical protein